MRALKTLVAERLCEFERLARRIFAGRLRPRVAAWIIKRQAGVRTPEHVACD